MVSLLWEQDDAIMMSCLLKSQDDDIMTLYLSKLQDDDDDIMMMCISKSQDDNPARSNQCYQAMLQSSCQAVLKSSCQVVVKERASVMCRGQVYAPPKRRFWNVEKYSGTSTFCKHFSSRLAQIEYSDV